MESGKKTTTAEKIALICEHYHICSDYLLGLTDDPSPRQLADIYNGKYQGQASRAHYPQELRDKDMEFWDKVTEALGSEGGGAVLPPWEAGKGLYFEV